MQIEWLKPQRQIESVKVGEFGERLKPCPAAPNSRPEGPPSSGPRIFQRAVQHDEIIWQPTCLFQSFMQKLLQKKRTRAEASATPKSEN